LKLFRLFLCPEDGVILPSALFSDRKVEELRTKTIELIDKISNLEVNPAISKF
jgi:hypothetical protein